MTSAVIFDLDGTLVDSPRAIVRAFTATFASMSAPVPDPAQIRSTIGIPLEQAFSKLLGVPPDDPRVGYGVQQYQLAFRETIVPAAAELLFPGVADGLAALRGEGYALALATSKVQASAEALLAGAGLLDLFTVVVGADRVTRPKPDPETASVILRELKIPAGYAVVVGDTTHDLLMAADAGIRSVAVTYGVHSLMELTLAEPTWVADTFGDVLTCVRSGLAGRAPGALPRRPSPRTERRPA